MTSVAASTGEVVLDGPVYRHGVVLTWVGTYTL